MQTTMPLMCTFFLYCCMLYCSEGLLDADNTLLDVVKQLNSTFQQANMKISALEQEVLKLRQGTTSPVIFYAYLTSDTTVGADEPVRFDFVVTNVGNAYNPRHGHFTAPVDGYYHFSTTVMSAPNDDLQMSIVKNGVEIAKLYGETRGWQTGSGSVDIELAPGDMVWLMNKRPSLHNIHGDKNCLFSGFIINKKV